TDNKERVRGATHAYFDFVSHESEAFRLVFESDLRNDPAVRERVERVDKARAEILAAGLTGISQVAARYWLTGGSQIAQEEAEGLIAALSWRGIASFPLSEHTETS